MGFDLKPLGAQTGFEVRCPGFGPHPQDPSRTQRAPTSLDRLLPIEWVAAGGRSRMWTFEEVEHDRVVGPATLCGLSNAIDHITHLKRDTRVVETSAGKGRKRASTPIRNDRVELRHVDLALGGKDIEYGPKREPHPEPTDQNPGTLAKSRTGSQAQVFFRSARATVHENAAIDADQEVVDVPLSQFEQAVWTLPTIQGVPGATHDRRNLLRNFVDGRPASDLGSVLVCVTRLDLARVRHSFSFEFAQTGFVLRPSDERPCLIEIHAARLAITTPIETLRRGLHRLDAMQE